MAAHLDKERRVSMRTAYSNKRMNTNKALAGCDKHCGGNSPFRGVSIPEVCETGPELFLYEELLDMVGA